MYAKMPCVRVRMHVCVHLCEHPIPCETRHEGNNPQFASIAAPPSRVFRAALTVFPYRCFFLLRRKRVRRVVSVAARHPPPPKTPPLVPSRTSFSFFPRPS